jgi:hypothetical protein
VAYDKMVHAVDLTMVITDKPLDQDVLTLMNLSEETFQLINFIKRNTQGWWEGQ